MSCRFFLMSLKKQTTLLPEVPDSFPLMFFRGTVICRQTGDTEKLNGTTVDHLLVKTDLITGQLSAALHTVFTVTGDHGKFQNGFFHKPYLFSSVPR